MIINWRDETPATVGAGGGCPSCGYSIHAHAPDCQSDGGRAQRVAREYPDGGVYGLRIEGLRDPTEIAVVEAAAEFALRQHRANTSEISPVPPEQRCSVCSEPTTAYRNDADGAYGELLLCDDCCDRLLPPGRERRDG